MELRTLDVALPPRSLGQWRRAQVRYLVRVDRRGSRYAHFAFVDRALESQLDEAARTAIENQCLRDDARRSGRASKEEEAT